MMFEVKVIALESIVVLHTLLATMSSLAGMNLTLVFQSAPVSPL